MTTFPALPATEQRGINDPTKPLTAESILGWFGLEAEDDVPSITPARSLQASAVYACVRIISDSLAKMPFMVFRKDAGGNRERATDHPLWELLTLRPNADMSAFTLRKNLHASTLLWGNGYAEIVRDRRRRPVELWPIEPWRVRPFRVNESGELRYKVGTPEGEETLLRSDVLHLQGFTFDGVVGVSPIGLARRTLSAGNSADTMAAKWYRKGLRPSAVLKTPNVLSNDGRKRMRESWESTYAGPDNAGKVVLLEEGLELQPWTTMSLADAQFIESQKFRVEEICRMFGVPPHKVGLLDRSTNNNIEHQGLDFLYDTLHPHVESTEQECNWKLLAPAERAAGLYLEHLTLSIIAMDAKARAEFYKAMQGVSGMNGDEIRDRENMNRLPDGRGASYYVPSNLMPAPTPAQADALLDAWIKKGVGSKPSTESGAGEPKPTADDKVAKSE